MKKQNYHEAELGKVPDSVKNIEFKGTVIDASDCKEKKIADILSGKHDNDFIDKEKFQRNSYYLAYHKATEMLNWAESYREKTPPAMYGWICPRCGAVHSPFDLRCDCPPPVRTWISSGTGEWSVLDGKTEGGEGCR